MEYNLSIINVKVLDSSNIDVTFSDKLTTNLVTSNILITSDTITAPDSQVLQIKISGTVLSITCQPLTPLNSYYITFRSIDNHPFQSINGESKISEDGITNKYLITAPLSPDNPVKNYLTSFYKDSIYNIEDENSIIGKYIQSLAIIMSKALYDIKQVKNENYLSFDIIDEKKVRGAGPSDRLDEESAYEISRVGRTPTGYTAKNTFSFEQFPSYPIPLQKKNNTESLNPNSLDENGFFNVNSLILNLSNLPVTKVSSIIFTLNTITPVYVYDIPKFGYQIKDSKYDQEYGFTYSKLENNQIKLSEKILSDTSFDLTKIIKVDVEYESKNLGIVVDPNNVTIYTSQLSIREVIPPIINVFNFSYAPIVNGINNIPIIGGVTFNDPNTSLPHPAFKFEIPFRFEALPSSPGQYSIDYNTGTVYVYGADLNNDGTGPFPPLATYKYRLVYQPDIDYTYDDSTSDIVALSTGSLIENAGNISFNYEEVLIPGVDYKAELHSESLNERVENRLVAFNAFKTKNTPITNVFRIYNETSGEIYTLSRWSDDKVYFRFNTPPKVENMVGERVTFRTIFNEFLFVHTEFTNASNLRIFKIFLNNNKIVSATEDGIAFFLNTSLFFSNLNVFSKEKWFNSELNETANFNRLINVGEYIVDYINGIVYCAVSNIQGLDIGTTTYKYNDIVPNFPHVIAVDDLYYQVSPLNQKNKNFGFTSFDDGSIIPENLEVVDEKFLNGFNFAPYQVYNKFVGSFSDNSFIPGVTNQIKILRGIYAYDDLMNSVLPFNFAQSSIASIQQIVINSYTRKIFDTVKYDGYNYYVNIPENILYISSDITYNFTITRLSDSQPLWNIFGTIITGNPLKLILPGINNPLLGDQVTIEYTFSINDLSRIIVDYNKGDYFADYTYVADEIIVSYEYGNNVLDFRRNTNLPTDTPYFVTYKAGALRDALLKNFGTLVNIPELSNFDIDFERERYREALMAALSSFIQGPTISAIKNIGKIISHIEPEVIESAFLDWSLGSSLLNSKDIVTVGEFESEPVKFGNGLIINKNDQIIKFPGNSNIRLEEGTFETWIKPKWNGLDNDANLTFKITKDGYEISENEIFIGSSEYHPIINDSKFTISKLDNVIGTPNTNKDGIYIYNDKDSSGNFYRWYIRVIDGYVNTGSSNYKISINTDGKFYDNKSIVIPKPNNISILTSSNQINVSITGGIQGIDQGITFLSDIDHFILDFGEKDNINRLSIFKDFSGYMNFRIYDRNGENFSISADVSNWKLNEVHHVAASWKLNTINGYDEMHLFLDGFEVPNIIKYGQKLQPFLNEKFRTIDPEEIIGLTDRDIVGSIDLQTTIGSNTVTSSLNFDTYQIFIGDTIFIDEIGFSPSGYLITGINGQILTLNTIMPLTINNGRFSINRTKFIVTSDIDVVPNIMVTTAPTFITGSSITGTSGSNIVTSTTNFTTSLVKPGYLIKINNPSIPILTITQVSGNSLSLSGNLPVSISGVSFEIYSNIEKEIPGIRAIRPSYSISKDSNFNNILTISNNVYAGEIIFVRTLGLNYEKVKKTYYVWSSGQENVLMTQLPPPIALDEVKISKIILNRTNIGPSNSTLSLGVFTSNNLTTSTTVTSQLGRTLNVTIAGNNVDFSTPVQVIINGLSGLTVINEIISFTDYDTLSTSNKFINVNYVQVIVKPINTLKNALTVEVKEKYTITYSESSSLVPIIRYSYHIGGGSSLYNDGYFSVRDDNFIFSGKDINNYLIIHSPLNVAGYYKITSLSEDRKSILIQSTSQSTPQPLPNFSNGVYQVLNVSDYRSGLQNGYFTFEDGYLYGQPYFLQQGFYELEYFTYTSIKLDRPSETSYLGSDYKGKHHLNGSIDCFKIYSVMLNDTRVGEVIPTNQKSITKDFNSIKPLKTDIMTLMLVNFESLPLNNLAGFYNISKINKKLFHSSVVINENFKNSLAIKSEPLIISNDGILNTNGEGTIEFWVNPLFDSANDPVDRFYFDAFGAVIEEVVSENNVTVKLASPANKILNVKVKGGDNRIDYFSNGKLEIDNLHAIQENHTSISNSHIIVDKSILQVISVKIVDDKVGFNYFEGGSIGNDNKTIYFGKSLPQNNLPLIVTYQTSENKNFNLNTQVIRLNKKLPYQNTNVLVTYIPSGLQGDRISIFKDKMGYINFIINASGIDYVVRAPTRWARNTWHRIRASYKVNSSFSSDGMSLFVDGYQYSDVLYNSNNLFGKFPLVYGSVNIGNPSLDGYNFNKNIRFKDSINNIYIGSQYTGENVINALIDNLKISNILRPIYAPYGEPLDLAYNSNLNVVFPVTEDLFTTYLMDFNTSINIDDNFAVLKNRKNGNFDFSVNILDSFGIINSSIKVKEILEKLIKTLKPANSRVFIKYIK